MSDLATQILQLERAALDRWGKGDPDGYLEISAGDVTYFDPFQTQRINGRAELNTLYDTIRGKVKIERDEIVEPKVQLIGSDGAVLSFRFISQGSEGSVEWNCTEVYERVGEEWKIIHTHWSFTNAGMPAK